jgi:hypothetical protein
MHADRVFTRHNVELRIWVQPGNTWSEYTTADVSRAGFWVKCEDPPRVGAALQVRVELPGGDTLQMLTRVRRSALTIEDHPLAPGMSLEFIVIAPDVKDRWDAYIRMLKALKPPEENLHEGSQDLRQKLPPKHVMNMLRKMREAGELRSASEIDAAHLTGFQQWASRTTNVTRDTGPLPVARDTVDPRGPTPVAIRRPAIVTVQPRDAGRLMQVIARVDRGQSLFLRTLSPCELGQRLRVVLVHPETDIEFTVPAVVERVVDGEEGMYAGVQARFESLADDVRRRLKSFADCGDPDSGTWAAVPAR